MTSEEELLSPANQIVPDLYIDSLAALLAIKGGKVHS